MQDPIPKTTRAESSGARDYEVGYGRPPRETRFQPGKSGNPRGRPKAERHLGDALRDALHRKIVVVNGNGDKRNVLAVDHIFDGLVGDSARRDRAALRQLFFFIRHIHGGKPPDDRQQRDAEAAEAKESLRIKLDEMAARVREMPGFVELTLAPAEPSRPKPSV
jgi:hypothetical protein